MAVKVVWVGHLFSPHKCSHSLPLTNAKVDSEPTEEGATFSLGWYLCARKSPYAFHPLSQKLPNVAFETVKEGKDKEDSGTRPPQDLCQQPNKSTMFLDAGQKTAANVGWASVMCSLSLTYQQQEQKRAAVFGERFSFAELLCKKGFKPGPD